MAALEGFKKFSLTELEKVPPRPGIYAWYANIQVGAADWKKTLDADGNDVGTANLKGLLARHTSRFAPPTLKANVQGSFRDSWEGRLGPERFNRFIDAIGRSEHEIDLNNVMLPAKEMNRVFGAELQRGRLSALMTSLITPVFSAPLYIGRADDLKKRIREHFSDLDKWHRAIKLDPAFRERLRSMLFEGTRNERVPDIFATRAVSCGFSPDNLEVYVLDIVTELDVPLESAKELSAALEWFLNTWNRPILGRA
jgi:hypothetical protein